MKANYKKSFLGGILALVLGTSCCWLTSLAIWFGGATVLSSLVVFIGKFNTAIIILACILLALGIIQLWSHRKGGTNNSGKMKSR